MRYHLGVAAIDLGFVSHALMIATLVLCGTGERLLAVKRATLDPKCLALQGQPILL